MSLSPQSTVNPINEIELTLQAGSPGQIHLDLGHHYERK